MTSSEHRFGVVVCMTAQDAPLRLIRTEADLRMQNAMLQMANAGFTKTQQKAVLSLIGAVLHDLEIATVERQFKEMDVQAKSEPSV